MSKTVKRVITVMLIGLVAMLGAKAEAHWIVVKGHCYWHSLECHREDKDPGPINLPPLAELVATATQVELLCPIPSDPGHVETIFPGTILATRRTPIGQRAITQERDPNGNIPSTNLEWQRVVSDALFYTIPCPNDPKSFPMEVIVHEWSSVQMNLYLNNNQSIPHSAWKAGKCTLGFGTTPPDKLPPGGALYNCTKTESCHVQGGQLKCSPL